MFLPCLTLMSFIRTPCHIYMLWHHSSSLFSQSQGLWIYIYKVDYLIFGTLLLWQLLDQCPIAVQAINFKGRYLVGNTSCVIHKKTQQRTTTVFYWLFILSIYGLCYNCASYPNVHVLSSCPLVIYLMSYYLSILHLL